jgi:hypothetical protein
MGFSMAHPLHFLFLGAWRGEQRRDTHRDRERERDCHLYNMCVCVVVARTHEGEGLPLIQHICVVVARKCGPPVHV